MIIRFCIRTLSCVRNLETEGKCSSRYSFQHEIQFQNQNKQLKPNKAFASGKILDNKRYQTAQHKVLAKPIIYSTLKTGLQGEGTQRLIILQMTFSPHLLGDFTRLPVFSAKVWALVSYQSTLI